MSRLIEKQIRKTDIFGRWGGEEFIIITPALKTEKAVKFAEKIRNCIEEHQFDEDKKITVSIGVAEYKDDQSSEAIINRADKALYRAKRAGRNRVEKY